MQGIEFEVDEASSTGVQYTEKKKSTMVGFLARIGVSDATTANIMLLAVAAILFGITIFIYAGVLVKPERDLRAEARAILIMQNAQL